MVSVFSKRHALAILITGAVAMPIAAAEDGAIIRVQAQVAPIGARPPVGNFKTREARTISPTRRVLGGVADVTLAGSVSARIPLNASVAQGFGHVSLVLDRVSLAPKAASGGFFYNIYLDLPASGDVDSVSQSHFVGTLGAFELSAARQRGSKAIDFDITDLLSKLGPGDPRGMVVSFVRVSGANSPQGDALTIGELRVEASKDAP
jgi:tyrosinase